MNGPGVTELREDFALVDPGVLALFNRAAQCVECALDRVRQAVQGGRGVELAERRGRMAKRIECQIVRPGLPFVTSFCRIDRHH